MRLFLYLISFIILCLTQVRGFKVKAEDDKELILLLEITRHGARSPIGKGKELLNTTWDIGTGELTPSGERQHYFQGVKLRKKYIEELGFLPETFNKNTTYIMSTAYNRTIMSAYAQMQGLYPLGTGSTFSDSKRRKNSVPPLEITPEASSIINSGDVLPENYMPFPIHFQGNRPNTLLRGYDVSVCPVIAELKAISLKKAHEDTKDELQPLYDELVRVFDLKPEYMNLDKAGHYVDTYEMAEYQNIKFNPDISDEAKKLIPKFSRSLFYEGIYGNPKTAKLSSTRFLNYLVHTFRQKIRAYENATDVDEFYKHIKHIYFSAHDTSIAGFLTAIGQSQIQHEMPPLGSLILIELYKKGDQYYLNWDYNGEFLDINSNCNKEGDCSLDPTLTFFESQTIDNLEVECKPKSTPDSDGFPLWAIILLVIVGLLFVAGISGLCAW